MDPVFPVSSEDHPIKLPLMTHRGMWRIYSNLDLTGQMWKKMETFGTCTSSISTPTLNKTGGLSLKKTGRS
jgi:hypothetical protein